MRCSSSTPCQAVLLVMILCVGGGCQASRWQSPKLAKPLGRSIDATAACWRVADTESAYEVATRLEAAGDEGCVTAYLHAAESGWRDVRDTLDCVDAASERARFLYHSSVARLVCAGARFGRFDPVRGLKVDGPHGCRWVAVDYRGFLWQPEDFNEFVLVGNYSSDKLKTIYGNAGLGVPLVVIRKRDYDEPMRRRVQAFSATALLLPSSIDDSETPFRLEFCDPVRVAKTRFGNQSIAICRDLSAPYAYRASTSNRAWLDAFLMPGSQSKSTGLYAIEPHQPGKIPLIFVHGLLADATTWIAMLNELRANPEVLKRYQIWAFEYPTGIPFVGTARMMREELAEAIKTLDPEGKDAAMSRMVVVGHSMGGLVAKLQVTSSDTHLWDSLANRPFDQVIASDETRADLASSLFFRPQLAIKRVIFIATPHRGAGAAQRLVGRIASSLVDEPDDRRLEYQKLIENNPGLFSQEVQDRIPTSIDMLQPTSCVLQAIERLPIATEVTLHSIIADNDKLVGEPTDGVVPVTSAWHSGVASECVIRSTHTKVQSTPEATAEVLRILRLHE